MMLTPVYLNSSGSNSDENHKLETISQLHFFLFLLRIGKEGGEGDMQWALCGSKRRECQNSLCHVLF